MICTIRQFCDFVRLDLNGVLDTIATEVTRPFSDAERVNLSESYTAVSKMFSASLKKHPELGNVHISTTNMLMEYKLPAASSWCDMVLLGDGRKNKQVFIIELKNWLKNNTDVAGEAEGLIGHQGERLHPSDQVKGYVEYCRCFHSAVLEANADVNGCVFFTKDIDVTPYTCYPNDKLTSDYPVYNTDMAETLSDFIADKIVSGEKTSEYRACSDYWNNRLANKHYDTVVFHKGYTNTTATYKILSIGITTQPNDLGVDKCWEIKLKKI